jgi:hypothetical protein
MNAQTKLQQLQVALKEFIHADWNGGELVASTPTGDKTLAQIAIKPLKNSNGDWVKVKRVSCKPYILVPPSPNSDMRKRAAFITVKDYPPASGGLNDIEIKIQAYIAAIYTATMPYLVGIKSKWAEASMRKEFFENMNSLLSLSDQDLAKLAAIVDPDRLLFAEGSHGDLITVLQASLGLATGNTIKNVALDELLGLLKNTGGKVGARGKIAQLVKEGATRGAIGQVNRKTSRLITDSFGDSAPAWLHTPLAQRALEGLSPAVILIILEFDTTNRIPVAIKDKVRYLAEKALESFADHAAGDIMDELFTTLGPVMNDWIAAAQGISELESTEEEAPETAKAQALLEALSANTGRSSRSM